MVLAVATVYPPVVQVAELVIEPFACRKFTMAVPVVEAVQYQPMSVIASGGFHRRNDEVAVLKLLPMASRVVEAKLKALDEVAVIGYIVDPLVIWTCFEVVSRQIDAKPEPATDGQLVREGI